MNTITKDICNSVIKETDLRLITTPMVCNNDFHKRQIEVLKMRLLRFNFSFDERYVDFNSECLTQKDGYIKTQVNAFDLKISNEKCLGHNHILPLINARRNLIITYYLKDMITKLEKGQYF